MDAEGVEDGNGVVDHLSLEIMDLLPDDTDGRTDLTVLERMTVIDILNTRLDDMALRLFDLRIKSEEVK